MTETTRIQERAPPNRREYLFRTLGRSAMVSRLSYLVGGLLFWRLPIPDFASETEHLLETAARSSVYIAPELVKGAPVDVIRPIVEFFERRPQPDGKIPRIDKLDN